ncbi:carboxylating nicotinate-nucleotide diphosphorylase [Lapidilactobacillus gannanensis]|uniref:nicotinate-nucleotide diphosphorylase (carboxylating) n=1 Tax=Lapidilactobacillus gannanensis TaxID=2486002 RepID=A0ABW4BNS8_9LACO|nr:carboxylating nicotinate-nucleotide diphosphorylase [Lapidilactobacillus gannanensis]
MNPFLLRQALTIFINEDMGFGDASASLFGGQQVQGQFIAKTSGYFCGQQIPQTCYDLLGNADYQPLLPDGAPVKPGTICGRATGDAATILAGERIILNLMQRLSGITTTTQAAVALLADPTIKITDTRKTAPGLRLFDKYAVRCGGGVNHRFGLDQGLMLKDNHLAAAGGVSKALKLAQATAGPLLQIEVEVETKNQLLAAIKQHAQVIMFDNQSPATIKAWQQLVPATTRTEASGGIDATNLASYRHCGVDFISMGSLTNDVRPLDLSFNLLGVTKK